jgi:mRNA interferase MazF
MRPGNVVIVDFPGAMGIKRRPAIVISTSTYHAERPDAILATVTTQVSKATSKTDYVLQDWEEAGLKKPSAVRSYIGTRSLDELTIIGELTANDWAGVQKIIRLAIEF